MSVKEIDRIREKMIMYLNRRLNTERAIISCGPEMVDLNRKEKYASLRGLTRCSNRLKNNHGLDLKEDLRTKCSSFVYERYGLDETLQCLLMRVFLLEKGLGYKSTVENILNGRTLPSKANYL